MSLQQNFQAAVKDCPRLQIKENSVRVNSIKLEFYGLYKQGVEADFSKAEKGYMFTKTNAKYNAWAKVQNLSAEDAQKRYVEYFEELKAKYGLKPETEDKEEDWVDEK